jgi:hypothetical protein
VHSDVFDREDKFHIGSLELDFAEVARKELPQVLLNLKERYLRAVRDAAIHGAEWSEAAHIRAELEEALVARKLLDELLGC